MTIAIIFRNGRDLRHREIIWRIQQLLTNGGFELIEEESTCPLNQVKTEDGWADEIMVHMVRCKHCGQVFTCVVNTYRGSGSFKKDKGSLAHLFIKMVRDILFRSV